MNNTGIEATENKIYISPKPTEPSTQAELKQPGGIFSEPQPIEQNPEIGDKVEHQENADGTKNKHTETEIKNALSTIFNEYGFEYKTEYALQIERRTVTLESLLQSDDFGRRLNEISDCLKRAFDFCTKNKTEKCSIEEVIDRARKYKIAISTGWGKNLDKFDEALKVNKNGKRLDLKRIIEHRSGKDIKDLSDDEKKEYIKAYFVDRFKQYLKQTGDKDTAAKLQVQDFGVLLANTSDEDKKLLMPLVTEVINNSPEFKAIKILFNSFKDGKYATELADGMSSAELNKLQRKEDRMFIRKHMSEAGLKKSWNEFSDNFKRFCENNFPIIKKICEKREQGYALEGDEIIIAEQLDKFIEEESENTIGVADNINIDKNTKKSLLAEINNFAKQYPTYRQYLEYIANYVNSPEANLSIAREEFNNLLNEATNGNYETVVNDILRNDGKKNPLKMDTVSQDAQETSAYGSTGFETLPQSTIQNSQNRIDELRNSDSFKGNPENKTPIIFKEEKTFSNTRLYSPEDFDNFCKKTSNAFNKIVTGKVEVVGTSMEQSVLRMYELKDHCEQAWYLAFANNKWFDKFIRKTDKSVVAEYRESGGNGINFDRTRQMDEIIQEDKKQRNIDFC